MVTRSARRFGLTLPATLLVVVAGVVSVHAGCDPTTDPDMSDIANARAVVAVHCDCSAATPHRAYVHCAAQQAATVLTNEGCARFVRRCAAGSTCGRGPTRVTCCISTATGTRCRIKTDTASCGASHGSVGVCTSCCDACPPPGSGPSCSASTTTTLPAQYCAMPGACNPPCPDGQGCAYLRELGCGCVPEPACGVQGNSCGGNCPSGCEPCHLDTFNGQCLCGCAAGTSTTSSTTTTTTSLPCVPTGVGVPCDPASTACCPVPNGSVFCGGVPTTCRLGVCDPGYANCNMEAADGCEVNLGTDPSNCGSCHTVCAPGTSCLNGSCH